jgi:hypothetical protein
MNYQLNYTKAGITVTNYGDAPYNYPKATECARRWRARRKGKEALRGITQGRLLANTHLRAFAPSCEIAFPFFLLFLFPFMK